jgi:hypothetical protein
MKKHFCLLCILAMAPLQSTMRAQDSERPIARELVSITVNPSSDYTKLGRAKFVRILSTYCTEVMSALPTNTPTEDAWVRAEGNTTDTEKIRRLVSSPEFIRRELKSVFEGCVESTANILRVRKLTEKGDSSARYEAQELLRIAFDLNADNDILLYASRAGLSRAAWRLDFLPSIRKAILVAALRTLENR